LATRTYSTPAGWLDQSAAAKFLGVTVATIRRRSRPAPPRHGKAAGPTRVPIPFYRIGHRALYREHDLRAWLEAQRVN